jgi:hypothetical protein
MDEKACRSCCGQVNLREHAVIKLDQSDVFKHVANAWGESVPLLSDPRWDESATHQWPVSVPEWVGGLMCMSG